MAVASQSVLTDPVRRTQTERRGAAESRLLTAATELVAQQGVSATSIAQICERAGFSRGLVTHHFGTRAALFERLVEVTRSTFVSRLPQQDAMTGLETLLAMVATYADCLRGADPAPRAYLLLWAEAAGAGTELRPIFAHADERFRTTVGDLVRRGVADGSVRADADSRAVAACLLGILRGLGMQHLVDPGLDLDALRDPLVETVRAMLRPPTPRKRRP